MVSCNSFAGCIQIGGYIFNELTTNLFESIPIFIIMNLLIEFTVKLAGHCRYFGVLQTPSKSLVSLMMKMIKICFRFRLL